MADKSSIEWTDATWNPVRGCSRVSEGCRHCYAEGIAARFSGSGLPYDGLAKRVTLPAGGTEARWTGKIAYAGNKVLRMPLGWREPRRIFVNSMSDLFHENVPNEIIDRVFAVMALCPQHTFQILTKRPERMRAYLSDLAIFERVVLEMMVHTDAGYPSVKETCGEHGLPWTQPTSAADWWPLRNVWLGVSVEDQVTAETRIPYLLQTPAAIRFLSCEPLLGPVDLRDMCDGWMFYNPLTGARWTDSPVDQPGYSDNDGVRLDWIIVGGESGQAARPMHPAWVQSLRDQCAAGAVPFFFKQWGEWAPVCALDDKEIDQFYKPAPAREPDATRKCLVPQIVMHRDGSTPAPRDPRAFAGGTGAMTMFRSGKKRSGRKLDERTHDEFPEVRND